MKMEFHSISSRNYQKNKSVLEYLRFSRIAYTFCLQKFVVISNSDFFFEKKTREMTVAMECIMYMLSICIDSFYMRWRNSNNIFKGFHIFIFREIKIEGTELKNS